MRFAFRYFYAHVVTPFRAGTIPHGQLSRGAGFGIGVALLPMLGQLYLAPALWALCRPIALLRFNLPVALGMVLLISPPLKVPLFYVYLLSGEALLSLAGMAPRTGSTEFKLAWDALSDAAWMDRFSAFGHLLSMALERYALPLGVGGTVWAVVIGGCAGVGTAIALARRRKPA